MIRRPTRSTLCPYTTLFRSTPTIPAPDSEPADVPEVKAPETDDAPSPAPSPTPTPSPSAGGDSTPDRKSTRLNSSHANISYAVFCLKKKKTNILTQETYYDI